MRLDTTLAKLSANKNSSHCSIVFSCWTRSLDIVANYFDIENIKFARIDGTYSLSQRQKILENYHTDDQTRILLMTTGTGAVGLDIPIIAVSAFVMPDAKCYVGSISP